MSTVLRPHLVDASLELPAAGETPLDVVFIEGFVAHTVIGIHHDELHDTQPIQIDLQAGVPRPRACDSDLIDDTLDYSVLRARLLRLMAEHRVQLLEALAEQIAHIVLHEFRAHWVKVRVAKPRKFEDVAAVGVVIERRREPNADGAHRGSAMLRVIGSGMVPGSR